jgi:histidinol dehydrogenase
MHSPVLRVQHWATMDASARTQLLSRGTADIFNPDLRVAIGKIIDDVWANGDEAVCRALRDFDGVALSPEQLRVTEDEVEHAVASLDNNLVAAVDDAIDHIRRFNEQVMARVGGSWRYESDPGLWVGEQTSPIASAGLFCPSGKASYPSVMAHIGTPATVAGVPKRVVITPPVPGTNGAVDPATLLVAQRLGITDIFRVNGPAGVAAVAFGTDHIPSVVKVMGPGSPAVVCAQIEVQRYGCATMMLLGPTESMIIADESADVSLVAADLLIEAEHGTDSTVVLVLIGGKTLVGIQSELARQIAVLPLVRQTAASAALGANGGCVVVGDEIEACEVANAFGAEHLQLATSDPEATLKLIHNAAEVLLGQHTPFSAGNFVLGPPASLPTSGFASVSSGVTVEAFLKRTAIARASDEALRRVSGTITALADHEGFPAHANALRLRHGGWPTVVLPDGGSQV